MVQEMIQGIETKDAEQLETLFLDSGDRTSSLTEQNVKIYERKTKATADRLEMLHGQLFGGPDGVDLSKFEKKKTTLVTRIMQRPLQNTIAQATRTPKARRSNTSGKN